MAPVQTEQDRSEHFLAARVGSVTLELARVTARAERLDYLLHMSENEVARLTDLLQDREAADGGS